MDDERKDSAGDDIGIQGGLVEYPCRLGHPDSGSSAASVSSLGDTIHSVSVRSLGEGTGYDNSALPTKTQVSALQQNPLLLHESRSTCGPSQIAPSRQPKQTPQLVQIETDGVDVLSETSINENYDPAAATQGRLGMHRRSGMMKNTSMSCVLQQDSPGLGWVLDGWESTKAATNNSTPSDHAFAHFSPHGT